MLNVKKNIILKCLLLVILVISILLLFLGVEDAAKYDIPLFVGTITACVITLILYRYDNDKFVPKIYLITCLFHFLVALFIQILKYNVLNLHTYEGFAGIGIDNDGVQYNAQAINILNNIDFDYVHNFSYIVAIVYKLFGINEFNICIVNCLSSGFVSSIIYMLSKKFIQNIKYCKILGYVVAFSFTVAAYTSVLMRDVFIFLFSYCIIFSYYKFQQKFSLKHLLITILFFLMLCFFRAYAAGAVLGACILAHFIKLAKFKINKNYFSINKYTILLTGIFIVLISFCIYFASTLNLDYIISLFDMETILKVSEEGYGGANSSFGVDRVALSHILPLFLAFGYFCMFFAPFPHQWLLARNIVQAFSASETIILYFFLIPSFFKGVINGFKDKNFIIMASFFYILFVFTFYGMILDNSGAVFRGRAPFIPLIYMISFYCPAGLFKKVLNIITDKKHRKWLKGI